MKKIVTMIAALMSMVLVNAQNYEVLHVADYLNMYEQYFYYCETEVDGVIVYGIEDCPANNWVVNGNIYFDHCDSILVTSEYINQYGGVRVEYQGCGDATLFITFVTSNMQNPFAEPFVWKRTGESTQLYAPGNVVWSTGETEHEITVTEPGTYSVTITDACGSETYSIQVRDNVEIELATCDLETNLNMVTWPTTPAQAEYVGTVEIKRDGMVVGTAPYTDGYFLDNIGSDAASRTYTITALATDGTPCPIASYPKETIHMAYLTGINNTIEVNWNAPTGYELLGYNICEWHPGAKDGDLTVIDFVGASVTSYTCSENQFNEGHVVVQGVENGRTESRLLSNRSYENIVGLGEHQNMSLRLYPNPTTGTFTVEGASTLTVFNTLGQVIARSHEENGTHTFTLRSGIYFIKSDEGVVKKVVVE